MFLVFRLLGCVASAALLLAACLFAPVQGNPPPQAAGIPPCIAQDSAPLPAHCVPQRIEHDLLEMLQWYEEQTISMRQTNTYPAQMLDELAIYYTGDLLHEAREQIYYNQQMGQIVLGEWQAIGAIDGPHWDASGQRAEVRVRLEGYRLIVWPETSPTSVSPGAYGTTLNWVVALVYDAQGQRWKIDHAHTRLLF